MPTQDSELNFKKTERNPLSELTTLRLEVSPDGEGLELACQLRFSTGEVSVNGREYTIGVTEARLQLSLEGCETAMGCDFGNADLAILEEEKSVTTQAGFSGSVGGAVSLSGIAIPSASVQADISRAFNHVTSEKKSLLPMIASSGNAWKVKVASTNPKGHPTLEGNAIDGQRLCRLHRKEGGNRLSVTAELQVRRSKVSVVPTKGNIRGKLFSLKRNKDAVVTKVLEKAIRREASTIPQGQIENTIVASKTEITQE